MIEVKKLTAVIDPMKPYSAESIQLEDELNLKRRLERDKNNISFIISINQSFVSFIGLIDIL